MIFHGQRQLWAKHRAAMCIYVHVFIYIYTHIHIIYIYVIIIIYEYIRVMYTYIMCIGYPPRPTLLHLFIVICGISKQFAPLETGLISCLVFFYFLFKKLGFNLHLVGGLEHEFYI